MVDRESIVINSKNVRLLSYNQDPFYMLDVPFSVWSDVCNFFACRAVTYLSNPIFSKDYRYVVLKYGYAQNRRENFGAILIFKKVNNNWQLAKVIEENRHGKLPHQ